MQPKWELGEKYEIYFEGEIIEVKVASVRYGTMISTREPFLTYELGSKYNCLTYNERELTEAIMQAEAKRQEPTCPVCGSQVRVDDDSEDRKSGMCANSSLIFRAVCNNHYCRLSGPCRDSARKALSALRRLSYDKSGDSSHEIKS